MNRLHVGDSHKILSLITTKRQMVFKVCRLLQPWLVNLSLKFIMWHMHTLKCQQNALPKICSLLIGAFFIIFFSMVRLYLKSLHASGNFCRLLINFANSLDPDQAWQYVRPDLDPTSLIFWWYSQKNFLKLLILEKISIQLKKIAQHAKS